MLGVRKRGLACTLGWFLQSTEALDLTQVICRKLITNFMCWTWGTCLLLLLMFAWREIVISCKNWDKTILQLVYNAPTSNKHFLFYGTKPSKDRVFQSMFKIVLWKTACCMLRLSAVEGNDEAMTWRMLQCHALALAKLPIKHKVISIFKCSDLLYTKFFA